MNEPDDIRFGFSVNVSRSEWNREPQRINAQVGDGLRMRLADFIQNAKTETIEHTYDVEKRLEIYAATPDVFWEIIERKAQEIAIRFK